MATFDCECINKALVDESKNSDKTIYTHRETLASISFSSNIPGFKETQCYISEGDPQQIVDKLYDRIIDLSNAAKQEMFKFPWVNETLNRLDKQITDIVYHISEIKKCGKRRPKMSIQGDLNELRKLKQDFLDWLQRIPVMGFNSSKFDINLIKVELFSRLMKDSQSQNTKRRVMNCNILKRNNQYLAITTKHAIFLDTALFLSAGLSYEKFLAGFKVKTQKGHWPHEYFTTLDKLNEKELPPREGFMNTLKKKEMLQKEYESLKQIWNEKGLEIIASF